MKARQKCRLAGPTTGCRTNQDPCIQEKQRVSQTAVVYTQKIKQTKNKYMYINIHRCMHVCMYDCMRSESESASQPQVKGVRVMSACARVCFLTAVVHAHKSGQTKKQIRSYTSVKTAAQPHLKGVRVRTKCASVCAATISLIHPLYRSVCPYVCLSVHVRPCG